MKKQFLLAFISLFSIFGIHSTYAAEVSHFLVELSSESAQVGEALDLTISAVDVDDNVVTDYEWSIIVLSDTDLDAQFPGVLEAEQSYTFVTSDAGSVKFENSVIFSREGENTVSVFDENFDDIFGEVSVIIGGSSTPTQDHEISLVNPTQGSTLTEKDLSVNGTTTQNHNVNVMLNNGELEAQTQSNSEGQFQVSFSDIAAGDYSMKAQVLDADGNVIGESLEITFEVDNILPQIMSTKLSTNETSPQSIVGIEVMADASLASVTANLNDVLSVLVETEEGVYTGNVTAPSQAGDYNLTVTLRNDAAKETVDNQSAVLTVTEPVVTSEEPVEIDLLAAGKPQITNIRVQTFDSKSVITWDAVPNATGYNLYKLNPVTGTKDFIEMVASPRKVVYITGEDVTYEDFYIAAVNNQTEEVLTDLSEATTVQTGPAEMIFLAVVALLLGYMMLRRKTKIS